jgi:hypothetical protein
MKGRFFSAALLITALLTGCPTRFVGDSDGGTGGSGTGAAGAGGHSGRGGNGTGGAATGGAPSATGGSQAGSGGTANVGGQVGAVGTGGTGGHAGVGGNGPGGAGGRGGTGGAASGGHNGTGGLATGGMSGSGGTATGGVNGTGGMATGGISGTGGMAGASGGTPGTGGSVQKSSLGASCSSGTTCQSGFCADGVCCDSACDKTCEQCGSNGVCGMPATDSACSPVSCPQSTACKSYGTSTLTTNLCKARGTCKTDSDCPVQYTAARTPCSGSAPNQMLCDGAGACKQPTVLCGTVASCPTSPGSCEITNSTGSAADPADSTNCSSDNGPACSGTFRYCVSIGCDGPSDCPSGTVCCWVWGGGQSSSCTQAQNCTSGPFSTAYVMCDPASGGSDCPSGQTCSGDFSGTGIFGTYGSSYHYCK